MKLYLGIDGGQSGTTAVIGDASGKVLGEGHAGPCNHVAAPERRAKFYSAIGESVRQAAQAAAVEPDFTAVCAGFSGGAADKEALTRELIHAERYRITDDAFIALTGATGGGPGVIVIAGTGSIAYGRNASGHTARAGGWGYVFGDEGSAFDIVRHALRGALRQEEGWGPPTGLHSILLEAAHATTANDLLHRCYTPELPRERVAELAPLVDQAARAGDSIAGAILENAAQSLAMVSSAVRRQLFAADESATVHFIGGVFQSEMLLNRFRWLTELDECTTVQPPLYEPARGALLEAILL